VAEPAFSCALDNAHLWAASYMSADWKCYVEKLKAVSSDHLAPPGNANAPARIPNCGLDSPFDRRAVHVPALQSAEVASTNRLSWDDGISLWPPPDHEKAFQKPTAIEMSKAVEWNGLQIEHIFCFAPSTELGEPRHPSASLLLASARVAPFLALE